MRQFLRTLVMGLSILMLTNAAWAQSSSNEQFMRGGVALALEDLQSIGRVELPFDPNCPQGGMESFENLHAKQSTVMQAVSVIEQVLDAVKPTLESKGAENHRCGQCRQNNLVSSMATIAPDQTSYSAACENRPTETFRLNVKDKSQIMQYTEALLRGRNSEGQRLLAGCPDPCAYYISTAQTKLHDDNTQLTLVIQCGQPRKGSVFSAKYNFNSGVVHQWTCSK